MKTPEQWKEEFSISDHHCVCNCARCKNGTELFLTDEDISAIQLDAQVSALEEAKKIVQFRAENKLQTRINQLKEQIK